MNLLQAKVKKLIQKNEEVGKLDKSIPFLLCRELCNKAKSLEYFLKRMLTDLLEKYKDQKVKLTPNHLKALLQSNAKYSFMEYMVQDVSDLEGTEGTKKPKAAKEGGALKKRVAKKGKPLHDDDMEENEDSAGQSDSSDD